MENRFRLVFLMVGCRDQHVFSRLLAFPCFCRFLKAAVEENAPRFLLGKLPNRGKIPHILIKNLTGNFHGTAEFFHPAGIPVRLLSSQAMVDMDCPQFNLSPGKKLLQQRQKAD